MIKIAAILFIALSSSRADEPFSIGLGTLSPSYTQTVGKDDKNVLKVNFQHKDDGFSYVIGDPQTGSTSYFNLGNSANAAVAPPAVAKELQSPEFVQKLQSAPHAHAPQVVHPAPAAPQEQHQQLPQQQYQQPPQQQYQQPPQFPQVPQYQPAQFAPLPYQQVPIHSFVPPAPAAPVQYQPAQVFQSAPAPIIPAGFSYHALDGQSFIAKGATPNFVVGNAAQFQATQAIGAAQNFAGPQQYVFSAPPQYSGFPGFGVGPAAESFMRSLAVAAPGGYARDHGGHTAADVGVHKTQKA